MSLPSDSAPATRRNERKDAAESRCRILEVARKLFGDCGVERVSMHQIAKTAQVGQGTLYRNYSHKGDLCLDLLKESAEIFLRELEDWMGSHEEQIEDLQILDEVIVRIVDFTDSKVHLLSAINSSGFVGDNMFFRQLHEIVCKLVKNIVEKNQSTVDPAFATDMLLSSVGPSMYMFERERRGYSKEQFVDAVRTIYVTGLL